MSDKNDETAVESNETAEEKETAVAEKQSDVEELQSRLSELEKDSKSKDETVGNLKRELKDAKKALEDAKKALSPETPEKTEQQPSEPDYAKLAFLKSNQVEHPDDQKVVLDEAERLKLPLTDVLQMEHIKTKLKEQNDQRVSQEGMPSGSGRKGSPTKNDVDYYLEHPDEVPDDLELHNKVIEARMKKHTEGSKFSDTKFVG